MDEVSSHVCLVLPSTDGKAARKIVPPRLRIPYWKGLGADSEEKHEPVSDIDTVVVDSLKALDPKRPIREADVRARRGAAIALGRLRGGQGELKYRTARFIRLCPQPAPMGIDNRSANRQPHPRSAGLRGVKCIEHAIEMFRMDARPGIVHCHKDTCVVLLGADQ